MSVHSAPSRSDELPIDLQETQDLRDTGWIYCATDTFFLRELSKTVHRSIKPSSLPFILSGCRSLLRNCLDREGKERLPIWQLACVHAGFQMLTKEGEIDDLCQRYVRRDDHDTLKDDAVYKSAAERVERMVNRGFPLSMPFKPVALPPLQEVEQGRSRMIVPERSSLISTIELFRAVHWMNSTLFVLFRTHLEKAEEAYVQAQKEQEEARTAKREPNLQRQIECEQTMERGITAIREMLIHVVHVKDERDTIVVSTPLLLGAAYHEAWADRQPTIEQFLNDYNPAYLEGMLHKRDPLIMRALEAVRVHKHIVRGRDFGKVRGEEVILLDERE